MNNQLAHEYVHNNSMGNLVNCQEIMRKTKEKIKPLYDAQNIMGYELILVGNSIDIQEQLIGDKFEGVTKGKFPFVYLLIQPNENSSINFERLMEGLDYIRVDV